MKRANWLALVLFVFPAALLYAGTAVEDLGVTKGDPIETGFLFVDGRHIDAPYIVERRGVDIYVNGVMVSPGPEYPPYDYRVATDPGDPPADISPVRPLPPGVDERAAYWARKARYVFQHYQEVTARAIMVDTYGKSPFIWKVTINPDTPDTMKIMAKDGDSYAKVFFSRPEHSQPPPTPDQVLKAVEKTRLCWEGFLKGQTTVIFCGKGAQLGATREKALAMLDALMRAATLDDKVDAVGRAFPSLVLSDGVRGMLRDFNVTPRLTERYAAPRAAWDAGKKSHSAAAEDAFNTAWDAEMAEKEALRTAAVRACAYTAMEDFGVTKGDPVETGFLFMDGRYIDAPYIVERRGVDIYINDLLVERGPEYPPFDYRVDIDPGAPPADLFPTDVQPGVNARDSYWA